MLQLSAHIMFEGGVFACLEYLEAVPWADDEEEKVTALMGQLQLESVGVAADVMKRCSALESNNSEDVLVRLLQSVTKGTHGPQQAHPISRAYIIILNESMEY